MFGVANVPLGRGFEPEASLVVVVVLFYLLLRLHPFQEMLPLRHPFFG